MSVERSRKIGTPRKQLGWQRHPSCNGPGRTNHRKNMGEAGQTTDHRSKWRKTMAESQSFLWPDTGYRNEEDLQLFERAQWTGAVWRGRKCPDKWNSRPMAENTNSCQSSQGQAASSNMTAQSPAQTSNLIRPDLNGSSKWSSHSPD